MDRVLILLGLAACGRVQFDPLGDAVPTEPAADATPDAPAPMLCQVDGLACTDGGFVRCGSTCFSYCNDGAVTHSAATDRCAAWSGTLAIIGSAAEQACVDSLVTNDAWIGLVQDPSAVEVDAGWRWSDGTAAPLTSWNAGEPEDQDTVEDGQEQCAIQGGGGWLDVACTESKVFICARPSL